MVKVSGIDSDGNDVYKYMYHGWLPWCTCENGTHTWFNVIFIVNGTMTKLVLQGF